MLHSTKFYGDVAVSYKVVVPIPNDKMILCCLNEYKHSVALPKWL